jgi:hypothetical protein
MLILYTAIESIIISSGQSMVHVWGTEDVSTGFWCGNLKERYHLEYLDKNGKIILEWIFKA